jgi:hypothetical protein
MSWWDAQCGCDETVKRGSVGKEGASRSFFGVDAALVEEEALKRSAGLRGSAGFKLLRAILRLVAERRLTTNPNVL